MTVLRFTGDVDIHRDGELARLILRTLANSTDPVVVDMEAVDFIDSRGLRLLIETRSLCAQQDRPLVIRNPSPAVSRLFTISGITALFEVEGSGGSAPSG